MFFGRKPKVDQQRIKILFTTDLHGSTIAFRRWLTAVKRFAPDLAIIGGDVAGKVLVPLVEGPAGWTGYLNDGPVSAATRADLSTLLEHIASTGQYGYVVSPDEHEQLAADEGYRTQVFHRLLGERLAEWLALAEEHLRPLGTRVVIMPGNDDPYELDPIFRQSTFVECADQRVVELEQGYELLSVGEANKTPWPCPRDKDEQELARHITALASTLRDPQRAIFNIHVPPYNTKLDLAPELTADLQLRSTLGGTTMVPVGSTAVRAAIERYQPALGLHGHIHESRGADRIGRTTILNPGSEFGNGVMRAAYGYLVDGQLRGHQLLAG